MALPPGPAYPGAIQTLFYLFQREGVLARNTRRWGHIYTRSDAIWGPHVLVSEPELIKQVLTAEAGTYCAGELNGPAAFLLGPRSVLLLDGADHLRERRRLNPPFSGERMNAYGKTMREVTALAISTWREGQTISLLPTMQWITLQVILRTVFGLTEGRRRDELTRELAALVDRVQSAFGMLLLIPTLQRNLGRFTPWASFAKARERVDQLLHEEIDERRAALGAEGSPPRDDVLSLLLQARDDDGQGMTNAELRDELMSLLVAGYETTSTALCWAFERVLSHPAVEERILAELAGAPDESGALPYLDAAIKETLRMRPIVPLLGRKTLVPVRLGDYDLPAGTSVFPAAYVTHHRADLYPEPEAFQPERFLGKKPDPYAWFPFGGGARRCLGMAFALQEMRSVLATVIPRVSLKLTRPGPLPIVLRGLSFAPEGGTKVVVGPLR